MLTKLKLAAAAATFALVAAHDIRTQIRTRKAAALFLAASKAYEETETAHEAQIMYLCHMLDQNEVPADEFDLIALHFHQE